jgi:hypothetical protein
MQNSSDPLATLREAGFTVALEGGRLRVSPASRLTPELRALVQAHRDEIIAALQREASPVQASRFLHSALPDGYRGPAIWHRGDVPGGVWQDMVEVTGNAGPGLFIVVNRCDGQRYTVGVAALIPSA